MIEEHFIQDLQNNHRSRVWWCMPLISVLERQKHVGLYQFEASLIYIAVPGQSRPHDETLPTHTLKIKVNKKNLKINSVDTITDWALNSSWQLGIYSFREVQKAMNTELLRRNTHNKRVQLNQSNRILNEDKPG